jgi:hypothetical protein
MLGGPLVIQAGCPAAAGTPVPEPRPPPKVANLLPYTTARSVLRECLRSQPEQ